MAIMEAMSREEQASPLFFSGEQIRVGQRLDVFLALALGRSRTWVQGLIQQDAVVLLPARSRLEAGSRLRAGDEVTVHLEASPVSLAFPAAEAIPLQIVHEDEAFLAVNKPPGLVVHPAAGHATGTLVNALVHHCGAHLAQRGGEQRLGIVHRLDKDTSGLLLVAKTDLAHERLARHFAERTIRKTYRTLVWGHLRRASGECRGRIGRHPVQRKKMAVQKHPEKGREAWTDYRVLSQGKLGAELACVLHTGRTHQIRVHLADLGHPIWGDLLYGRPHPLPDGFIPTRQMLHAACVELNHPLTGEPMRLEAPHPEDYLAARARLV